MWRREDDIKQSRFFIRQIELSRGTDVGFNTLQQAKPGTKATVDALDRDALLSGLGHRHATGDLEAVGMVRDRRILITARQTGVGDLLHGRHAIAPFRMHLEIAAILLQRRTIEVGIGQNAPNLGAA